MINVVLGSKGCYFGLNATVSKRAANCPKSTTLFPQRLTQWLHNARNVVGTSVRREVNLVVLTNRLTQYRISNTPAYGVEREAFGVERARQRSRQARYFAQAIMDLFECTHANEGYLATDLRRNRN